MVILGSEPLEQRDRAGEWRDALHGTIRHVHRRLPAAPHRVNIRPTLDRVLTEELSRADRYERIATLVLIDIDDFKDINSEGGVPMGDLLLTCLGGVILTSIRTMDIASRNHGQKFVIYLPETDGPGADTLISRIQQQLGAIADSIAGLTLRFSAGMVVAPEHGKDLDTLMQKLESALAHAKQNAPGSIVLWESGMDTVEEDSPQD